MAERLRQRDTERIDWDNVPRRCELAGHSDRRSLKNRLRVLIMHLINGYSNLEHRCRQLEGHHR